MSTAQKTDIVLADRDRSLQILAREFLQAAGHQVHSVQDGQAAWVAIETMRPRVLVTEILLPKIDGFALCRKVKASPELSQTRVLIFSILAARERSKEAGADAFLAKPLEKTRLIGALISLLGPAP